MGCIEVVTQTNGEAEHVRRDRRDAEILTEAKVYTKSLCRGRSDKLRKADGMPQTSTDYAAVRLSTQSNSI